LLIQEGSKFSPSGSFISINNNKYSLSHNIECFIEKEQNLITTSAKLVPTDSPLVTNQVYINLGQSANLIGVVSAVVKIRETQKVLGQTVIGSFNASAPISEILVNLIDTFNLTNLTLQIEISSVCQNNKLVCCDQLPSSVTLKNVLNSIVCTTTTTTTTTTIPPFCSNFDLPDSFYVTVVGYEALDGQQQISLVTRIGTVWSTSGIFPCGASYTLSMTCDSANNRFTYNGTINCCTEATKSIIDPTKDPLLFPNAILGKIVAYSDCYCANCTTTTTTTTTTTDFPTTTTKPPVPCEDTNSLTINGYAYYRTSRSTVNVPGVGDLASKCSGGHVCDRTNFLPQLITKNVTIDAQPISLNNITPIDKNVNATFSFNIPDTSILKGGASVSLKCLTSGGCHNGVTWVVLTANINGSTVILFNGCVLPNAIDNLNFECEDCCDWDGKTFVRLTTECDNLQEDVQLLKIAENLWELDTTLTCGDKINALVSCSPEVKFDGTLDSCKTKWKVESFSFPCATNARLTGNLLEPCECDKAPIFEFAADNFNGCNCCKKCYQCYFYENYLIGGAFIGQIAHEVTIVVPEDIPSPYIVRAVGGCDDALLKNGQYLTNVNGTNSDGRPEGPSIGAHFFDYNWIQSDRTFTLSVRDNYGSNIVLILDLCIHPIADNATEECSPIIVLPGSNQP
jgi:hypothetical protein